MNQAVTGEEQVNFINDLGIQKYTNLTWKTKLNVWGCSIC